MSTAASVAAAAATYSVYTSPTGSLLMLLSYTSPSTRLVANFSTKFCGAKLLDFYF